jgi:hypothetical protein
MVPVRFEALELLRDGLDGGVRLLRGDCNDDGAVDVSDALCTLRGLFAVGAIACRGALNVNGDGLVDVSDAIALLTHLFLGGPAPVAPFPACGPGDGPADAVQKPVGHIDFDRRRQR